MKDQSQAPTPTSTSTTQETQPDAASKSAETSSAPEAYSDFVIPEGKIVDKAVIEQAIPVFKELGLSQTQAQKLVDFYLNQGDTINAAINKRLEDSVVSMRAEWEAKTKADPEIGSKLPQVQAEIGKALSAINDQKLVNEFKSVVDFTGKGDHPAIVKVFYKLAQLVNEGRPVPGAGPSVHGQVNPTANNRPTLAAAMYPNLPH